MIRGLTQKIEAVLFYKGEPVSKKRLAEMLSVSSEDIDGGIVDLSHALSGRGLRIMDHNGAIMLATAPEVSSFMEALVKEELSRDLGKAAVETLSVVLYLGPIPRSRVDWIRGVNSTFILRNLMVRGLIERISNPNDERSFLYRPTFELLAHLGVARADEIHDYKSVRAEIAQFESEEMPKTERDNSGEEVIEVNTQS